MQRFLSLAPILPQTKFHVVAMLGLVAMTLLSGCLNVGYKHVAGRPLRVTIDPNVKVPETMQITGLTEAIGGALASAPGTGVAVKATGQALEKKGVQTEPVPQDQVRAVYFETFTAGLRRDPRFQLVSPDQAEATFHLSISPFFAHMGTMDRRIAAQAIASSELKDRQGKRLWRYVSIQNDRHRRELHNPDIIRRDPEFRTRALLVTVRDVAEEHLADLRR